ncbi:polycomb protein Su(z)12-like isoform X1 [Episyrphus balteatus]|uniref:polycomb protein Su(z)12-like isoform X1 n=1 Tax=Episyrphus balteatus TaxID=286459 RepID=UPI002485DD2A|nr:polycomb protein Su(z)12-like isoform X1 [Episyrphus balteatus]
MPPQKKREKDLDMYKLSGIQADQELFLQAFEKPTQIYRFLRNRHGTSPIFLNRTLSYMKDRMSRSNKKRSTFKVNTLLDTISHKTDTVGNYLNIVFMGLFDKNEENEEWKTGDLVNVHTTMFKITKNKRKESNADFQEILTHISSVTINPPANVEKYPAVCIPMQALRPLSDQHTIYKVLFRVEVLPMFNNNSALGNDDDMPSKRPKLCSTNFGCELVVFEKNCGSIGEGEYEAALQEFSSTSLKCFSPKKRTWETLPDSYIPVTLKFEVFNQCPMLKFRLNWSNTSISNFVDAKNMCENVVPDMQNIESNNTSTNINNNNNSINVQPNALKPKILVEEKLQIVYNFIYSNNTRQQTEYTQEVVCPWCGLDCLRLYSLLKHLKLCHARFNFTYHPAGNGARIDVTINDSYDGSYAGSPYDLVGPSGCSFARTCGPVRRTSVTNLLVCRPRRQKTCLDEFLVLDEDDLTNQRPYIAGHNRLYHHTETCLPVHPKELDIDSEGESDPLWLRQKTVQMIDEFSDVNEGEKELMKLWNLHVMKNGYVGDCQLSLACDMFLDAKGREIIQKNLYRNFILHMCSLFDYGLVSPETLYKTIQKLQGILSKYPDGQKLISESRATQLEFWLNVGIHKQVEQKLKSPQKQNESRNLIDGCSTSSLISQPSKNMKPPKPKTILISKNSLGLNALKSPLNQTTAKNNPSKTEKRSPNDINSSKHITELSVPKPVMKRRLSLVKDPPPTKKSSPQKLTALPPTEKPVHQIITRRQSVSALSHQQTHSLRTRLSVPLTKVDKERH